MQFYYFSGENAPLTRSKNPGFSRPKKIEVKKVETNPQSESDIKERRKKTMKIKISERQRSKL